MLPGYDSQHNIFFWEYRGIQRNTRQYRGIQGNTGKYMGTQGNRTLLQIEPSFSCGFANTPLQ